MADNPYKVLNVETSASVDDIRAAYRKLAKKYHPDLNPGNKEAEKNFKEINTAYEILGDPDKKQKFDKGEINAAGDAQYSHEAGNSQSANYGPFYYETQSDGGRYTSSGFGSDIFERLFGGRRGFQTEELPQDEHYTLEISFRDALLGAEKEMQLPSGKTVKVRIPPAIQTGEKLRLKNLVTKTAENGKSGDVYIEIRVLPSKIFTRSGKNLELEVPVTFYEAMLGSEIRIPTLENPITLKIPPGSTTGNRLKVKGKGAGAKEESAKGDLIVILKVVMPSKVDAELSRAVETWSKANPYNPRKQLEEDGGAK